MPLVDLHGPPTGWVHERAKDAKPVHGHCHAPKKALDSERRLEHSPAPWCLSLGKGW